MNSHFCYAIPTTFANSQTTIAALWSDVIIDRYTAQHRASKAMLSRYHRCAVSLVNHSVSMIENRCCKQASATLGDCLALIRELSRDPSTLQHDLEGFMGHLDQKLFSRLSSPLQDELLGELAGVSVPLSNLECSSATQDELHPVCIDESSTDLELELIGSLALYNYGLCYILRAKNKAVGTRQVVLQDTGIKLLLSALEMISVTQDLLENVNFSILVLKVLSKTLGGTSYAYLQVDCKARLETLEHTARDFLHSPAHAPAA